ncbi:MAG: hypothetical protein RIC35_06810 [Marinoscillum sp.]
MESRIKELQEKYWAGETSVKEEKELKAYFQSNPSLTPEGQYFQSLNKMKSEPKVSFRHPKSTSWRSKWSVAAVITAGVIAAALVIQDARKQRDFVVEDPQEAYEITRKALLMVSSGLNEGKNYSQEIKNINKAEELIKEN